MPLREVVALNLNRSDGVRALKTQHADRGILRRWLHDSDLGEKPISKIRTSDIERHSSQIMDRTGERKPGTVGPTTVRQLRTIISQSFKWAVRMDWVASNPAADCSSIPVPKASVAAADPAQYRRAIDAGDKTQPGLSAFIVFLGSTGCRKGEGLAMRWSSIAANVATISTSIAYVPGHGVFEKTTKTHQSRKVTIGGELTGALEEWRARLETNAEAAGVDLDPNGYIWSKDGLGAKPWRPDVAGKWVQAAGVMPLQLRHMNATQLLSARVPVGVVSKRLGHANASMTLDVYQEALPADDEAAANVMDGIGY